MKILKRNKGITLIALVVMIIVLLILAGVTLSFVAGENGILKRAINTVEVNERETAKEEANLLVADIVTKYYEEKYVNHESLVELDEYIRLELESGKETATREYIVRADAEGKVEVFKKQKKILKGKINKGKVEWSEEEIEGIGLEIKAEELTTEYVVEGNTVKIQVSAQIEQGEVTIIAPENVTLDSIITETAIEKVHVYTVKENGNYIFVAEGDDGRKNTTTVKVNRIIDKPRINISNNIGKAITINIENEYAKEANTAYTYYVNTIAKASHIAEKSFTVDGLTEKTEYTVKVVVIYKETAIESDEIKVVTLGVPNPPTTKIISLEENSEQTALQYPILTLDGVMNANVNCNSGDRIKLEMENRENETNYYSMDGGASWIQYIGPVEIEYPGEGVLKAKSENVCGTSNIKDIMPYTHDSEVLTSGIDSKAYDGDYTTCGSCSATGYYLYMQVSPECWGNYITFYAQGENGRDTGWIYFFTSLGGSLLKDGGITALSGESMTNLSAKSIIIPENTRYIGFTKGGSGYASWNMYEIWCSEQNLSGKTY